MADHEIRLYGIGGSEVGAIFGCDDARDAFSLWAEKKGGLARSGPNDRMVVGKALEQGVLTLYTHVTGREVLYLDKTVRDPLRPWMVYTPDAVCTQTVERRGVDSKVVFWDQRRNWGETARDIPLKVQLQAWWYMAGMDYDVWDIAALVGESMPRIYSIERDLEAERVMLARVEEWHTRYIVGNERPPIDGSRDATRWLQQAFPVHQRPDMREATADEAVKLDRLAEVHLGQKLLESERKKLDNEIREAIGDREGIQCPQATYTWRRTKDGKPKTDWESLAWALMTYHHVDKTTQDALLEQYSTVKPGIRRSYFKHDYLADDAEAAA